MLPAAMLAADDHLAHCEDCRKLVQDKERIQAAVSYLRSTLQDSTNHLPYEQLAAHIDDLADEVEREIVNSHLEACASCTAEAEALRAQRAEMGAYPKTQPVLIGKPPLLERLAAFQHRPVFLFAGAASMALLIAWVATLPLRKQVAELRSQVSELQRNNDALQTQVSRAEDLRAQAANLTQAQAHALASSPKISLALYDGGALVTLDKQGTLAGLTLPPALHQMVHAALISERVTTPDLSELAGKRGTLLGGRGEGVQFGLVAPVGIIVETDRPTLHWRPLGDATVYTVNLHDANFNKVATSDAQAATQWTVPQPLERGGVYSWQVIAERQGKKITTPTPPAPEARFKILEQAHADELARARKEYPNSHLVLGTLYARVGLLNEAEAELTALAAANPKSQLVRKLAKSVQAARRPK
jgi:hypothetical protein